MKLRLALFGLAFALSAAWARIVVRAGGGWISAAGLFMLGWTLRAR
jgi:hypothetical protein